MFSRLCITSDHILHSSWTENVLRESIQRRGTSKRINRHKISVHRTNLNNEIVGRNACSPINSNHHHDDARHFDGRIPGCTSYTAVHSTHAYKRQAQHGNRESWPCSEIGAEWCNILISTVFRWPSEHRELLNTWVRRQSTTAPDWSKNGSAGDREVPSDGTYQKKIPDVPTTCIAVPITCLPAHGAEWHGNTNTGIPSITKILTAGW